VFGEWDGSNVEHMGSEAGGTGTLRDLQLLGAQIIVPNTDASGPSELAGTGAPSGACVSGSELHRADGAGSSLYGCKNSAWVRSTRAIARRRPNVF
jgi:hypothetical protein